MFRYYDVYVVNVLWPLMMKDSAWVRLIIMNIQYTMKNLSLILKKYIF